MMKKLKRFALNDARMLSREELAAIEGGLTIDAVDALSVQVAAPVCFTPIIIVVTDIRR